MNIIQFPAPRVIEINTFILATGKGLQGGIDIAKLEGALGRIDNAIVYSGLDDVFDIAAKYAIAIGKSHSFSDGNKRTGLAVCLEFLSLNDYELTDDNDQLANAMVGAIISEISESQLADILYGLWQQQDPR
ncbi:MAG: death on curing protein [Osedax symbiont Rs1]|nr:MAG: death on curing protein [Osedax symbiont Rs1]